MTLEDLINAGFAEENWPEDLPKPGEANISDQALGPKQQLYRFQPNDTHAMEVVLDTTTVPDPAEGVCFMLNQFAYLWRTNKDGVAIQSDSSCRRINF